MPETLLSPPNCDPQVLRLQAIVERRPLMLGIETINACNARCVFCAYPKTGRKAAVMKIDLFQKVVGDYVDMGGGAVSLTPIVGDALLDPLLVDRLRLLRETPKITHVSFNSNGIAWDRRFGEDRRFILESIDSLDFSFGGLEAESYRRMFGIDAFEAARAAIRDMCDLKSRHDLPLEINLAFRVDRPIDELLADPRMGQFRRDEINSITGMNTFGNWGGMVTPSDVPGGACVLEVDQNDEQVRQARANPCFVFYMNPEITSTGMVNMCGCLNAEARELIAGDANARHLADIYSGEDLRKLEASFGTDAMPDICRNCSSYQDGKAFLGNPALASFSVGDNPWEVLRKNAPPPPEVALAEALQRLAARGFKRIGIYEAGQFTTAALSADILSAGAGPVVAVIDDDPQRQGARIANLPVVSWRQALALKIDAAVIGSQWYTWRLWEASRPLRDAGVEVTPIDPDHPLAKARP